MKHQIDYQPLIVTEKENNDAAYGLGIIVAIGIVFLAVVVAAQVGFGERGLRIALLGGSAVMVLSIITFIVWTFVSLGASISLRATKTSASVFMRADIVDAYTDRVRMDAARRSPEAPETVTVLPQDVPTGYLELQLPPPKDQLTF